VSLGYAGSFLLSFAFNLIPFAGPSNIVIAGIIALNMPSASFWPIGLSVALGSSAAKLIHFYAAFLSSRVLKEEQKLRLSRYTKKVGNIGALLIFLAAATPIPDEPIVIPLGLMKYSPWKFLGTYFVGKCAVTIPGAYLGQSAGLSLIDAIGNVNVIIVSVIITIAATIILIKVDLNTVFSQILGRKEKNDLDDSASGKDSGI
jgi:membrane protein YqaA with SNARE-associated domain